MLNYLHRRWNSGLKQISQSVFYYSCICFGKYLCVYFNNTSGIYLLSLLFREYSVTFYMTKYTMINFKYSLCIAVWYLQSQNTYLFNSLFSVYNANWVKYTLDFYYWYLNNWWCIFCGPGKGFALNLHLLIIIHVRCSTILIESRQLR